MTDSAAVLRYVRDIKAGWATAPADFPDKIMPYLLGLYEGQQHGNAEQVWNGRVWKGLAREFPDLKLGAWADIQAARKYIYSEAELLAIEIEPPSLSTTDGKPLLPGSGQVLLVAPTRSFKTFIALHWAKQLAAEGKAVAFYLGERYRPFSRRVRAYNSYYNEPVSIQIRYVDVARVLQDGLNVLNGTYPIPELDVAIVDTFRAVSQAEDENSNSEIGRLLRGFQVLAPLTIILHHTNKGGEIFAGAGAFDTNTDSIIEVKRVDGEADKFIRELKVMHNDYEGEFELGYELVRHQGSLVAVEVDLAERKARQAEDRVSAEDAEWLEVIAKAAGPEGWSSRADIIETAIEGKPTVERRLKSMLYRNVIEKERRGRSMYYRKTEGETKGE